MVKNRVLYSVIESIDLILFIFFFFSLVVLIFLLINKTFILVKIRNCLRKFGRLEIFVFFLFVFFCFICVFLS